jgi:hypothetical protein
MVCVSPCQSQSDCPAGGLFFCEALTPGNADGYCIPRSPAHCLSCDEDSDCGYLSEKCVEAPGDEEMACHVDCALAGDAACPPEYDCESVDVGGSLRDLCMPNVATCNDALGGYCDRINAPQNCARVNGVGSCLGQRTCLAGSQRFDACDALAPQCKAECSNQDPAGCDLAFCASATDGPDNCGSCGNTCPGYQTQFANVTCDGVDCGFSCQGEHYDVDDMASTGCEVIDSPLDNHTSGKATFVGTFPCTDDSSNRNIAGTIHSDARSHDPIIEGFNATTGAAPDYYSLFADGGACENEVVLTLDVNGSGNLNCYRLTVVTNVGSHTCNTNASGVCTINQDGTGVYDDDTTISIRVEKTCATSVTHTVSYTVVGHL